MSLQIRRRKDLTIPQEGYITVLWFTRCCARHEGAERLDKWLKYCSSAGLSLVLCVLSFFICSVEVGLSVLASQCMPAVCLPQFHAQHPKKCCRAEAADPRIIF